jgi:hypothetical protein
MKAYSTDENYGSAVALLLDFKTIMELVPGYDKLIIEYLQGIYEKYSYLLDAYNGSIDKEIEAKAIQIFQGNHYKAYQASKNAKVIFDKLMAIGRNSPAITKKKALWFKLIQQNKEQMEFTMYSGKK